MSPVFNTPRPAPVEHASCYRDVSCGESLLHPQGRRNSVDHITELSTVFPGEVASRTTWSSPRCHRSHTSFDSSMSTTSPLSVPPQASPRRPSISPLQFPPSIDERKNINRSLRICGFSSSPSTSTFPLSPVSPLSPLLESSSSTPPPGSMTKMTTNPKLPELEIPLMLSPPTTPLALVDVQPLPTIPVSEDENLTRQSRARRQPLRSDNDQFTPAWVRGQGFEKEGYCSMCESRQEEEEDEDVDDQRWFRLKDGSYWYHRQFVHGVSSISGVPFAKPMETRCVANERGVLSTIEGLCGTCSNWHTYETYRTRVSGLVPSRTLWYRHAHGCHPQTPIPRPNSTARLLLSAGNVTPRSGPSALTASVPPFISLPIVAT